MEMQLILTVIFIFYNLLTIKAVSQNIWIQLADAYLAHAKKGLIDDTHHARDLGLIYVK